MRYARLGVAALLALAPAAGHAGVYTDDLTKCVVAATSEADQVQLMRWMFSALSTNPALSDMVTVKPAQIDDLSKSAAALMQRLLLKDCRTEVVTAIKYEGPAALGTAFNTLGNVAGRNLMTNPATMAAMMKLQQYSDSSAFDQLGREAGIPMAPPKPDK